MDNKIYRNYRDSAEYIQAFLEQVTAKRTLHQEIEGAHQLLIESGVVPTNNLIPDKDSFIKVGYDFEKTSAMDEKVIADLKQRLREAMSIPGAVAANRKVNPKAMDHMQVLRLPEGWYLESVPETNHTKYIIKDARNRTRGQIYFYYLTGGEVELYPRYRVVDGYAKGSGRKYREVRIVDSATGMDKYVLGPYRSRSDARYGELLTKATDWLRENVEGYDDVTANW